MAYTESGNELAKLVAMSITLGFGLGGILGILTAWWVFS